jgi:hypothetical protein
MGLYRQSDRTGQSWRILLALLCILLVAVGATVQVAHTHADGTANHADCSLCVAAHAGMQAAAAPTAAPTVAAVFTAVEPAPATAPSSAVYTFALFTRPPPASVSPA